MHIRMHARNLNKNNYGMPEREGGYILKIQKRLQSIVFCVKM